MNKHCSQHIENLEFDIKLFTVIRCKSVSPHNDMGDNNNLLKWHDNIWLFAFPFNVIELFFEKTHDNNWFTKNLNIEICSLTTQIERIASKLFQQTCITFEYLRTILLNKNA